MLTRDAIATGRGVADFIWTFTNGRPTEDAIEELIDCEFNLDDVDVFCGTYRAAIVFSDFVVKMPIYSAFNERRSRRENETALMLEYNRITEFRNTAAAQFFPDTKLIKGYMTGSLALVQEKISRIGDPPPWNEEKLWNNFDSALGIGYDMHSMNYGWRTVGNSMIPVYVDVDLIDDPAPSL